MKAVLMAAGLGTRLRPVTNRIPKCMVPIKGIPLLNWWLNHLENHGVTDALINLHYLPEVVISFVREYKGNIKISLVHEPKLLGSQGTLYANREFLKGSDHFLVIYADNLTDLNLTAFMKDHFQHPEIVGSMALFHASDPSRCGIVKLDDRQIVSQFEEKPAFPKSDLANAGVYIFNHRVWEWVQSEVPSDIGFHLMPKLIGKIFGYIHTGFFMDIGTTQSYQEAIEKWPYEGGKI
ncbi:nucleotidyltransferase family protein [Cohnella caldifontis]|uniref:nucleotidyltransferase family protein n=1 Tax=Cohnella caldifontis TaxID=3027471 RepID=UPI0023EAF47C|nr:nucleotidyltransferase family protein [Cohnella sp. YIM B05605]